MAVKTSKAAKPIAKKKLSVKSVSVKTPPKKPAKKAAAPAGYKPAKGEEYMGPKQLEYFRQKLLAWRDEIERESEETLKDLAEQTSDTYGSTGDDADLANDEAEKQVDLHTRDRARKVLIQIDSALQRIHDGTYGYSEISGEPIGLARLEARPIVRRTIEEQEEHEARERLYS
jgi:DnaK suppressor protein